MKKRLPVVVIDSAIPFLEEVLAPHVSVVARPGSAITTDDLRDADALVVRTRTRCNERLLSGTAVRLIITATIGFDHIDRVWCEAHGIRVVTAAGCNARGVLQWVSAVLAGIARKEQFTPTERTLGIVGVGHVGSAVKACAEVWGFRVLCCDPPREERERCGFRSLQEVASEADILTFHTPLDSSTYHLCDADLLRRMKPTAWILNSSRGPVLDERALLEAPNPFVLDVWEEEPNLRLEVLQRAVWATPHVAGYTVQGKANASAIAVAELSAHFGLPIRGWYPPQVERPEQRCIAWEELLATIDGYYDLEEESRLLKADPARFEAFRDGYRYRLEYF
ncbi:MAG: 4-phosphoerythronate dehydrogenase [Alistipes sp.]|nr:4-phosphoerythronate dehydrogenase [Alistipes sp.]